MRWVCGDGGILPMNISVELKAAARRAGNKVALIDETRRLTHNELAAGSEALAARFLAEGLTAGDRVAIHAPNSIDTALAIIACFHAGLVAVPINVRFKAEEVEYIIGHCKPRLMFVHSTLAGPLRAIMGRAPSLQVWTELPKLDSGRPLETPDSDLPALVLYTSGTTARPKGVTHTLRTLMASAHTMYGVGIDSSTVSLVALSMMHTADLCCTLLPPVLRGGTAVLLAKFDAAMVLDAVERHHCTWTIILPALMQSVAVEQERQPRNLGSMRYWLTGGDCASLTLQTRWQQLSGRALTEGYAMSESMIMTYNRANEIRAGSIGKAAEGVEIVILDRDFKPAAPGVIGQIACRSPANFICYWENASATANAFHGEWMLTGDLARMDEDGFIWFHGRLKEIIIRAGSNISPQEVEEVLVRHPAVLEAGVIGAKDDVLGERVHAFVTRREGRSLHERELIEFARLSLADYKTPERIVFLDTMPKGITGKVQRRALKDL